MSAALNGMNALAGPSQYRPQSPQDETPSPINALDEPEERMRRGSDGHGGNAAGGQGGGVGGGISKNGLSVHENGDVTKVPAFLNKLYR